MTNLMHSGFRYVVERKLGKGGMGIAFKAKRFSQFTDDNVVLKFLLEAKPENLEMLIKEAKQAVYFSDHDNIVTTHGLEKKKISELPSIIKDEIKVKSDKGFAYYMVMEYVNGATLDDLYKQQLKKDSLIPTPISAFILSKICSALMYAHKFIIHRDISPDNIIISSHGSPKLMDFGIALGQGEEHQEFAGKFSYFSPEHIDQITKGTNIDKRSDIYALGLVAYQIITGINPLAYPKNATNKEIITNIMTRIAQGIPKAKEIRDDVPEELSEIISKMLEPRIEKRYQSAADIAIDLRKSNIYITDENSLSAYILKNYFTAQSLISDDVKKYLKLIEEKDVNVKNREFTFNSYTESGKRLIKETQEGHLPSTILAKQEEK